jgi:hypothetical protein
MKSFKNYLKENGTGYAQPVDVEAQRRQDFERNAMNTPNRSGYKPSEIDDPNAPEPTDQEREVARRKYEERQAQLTNQVQAEEEAKNPGSMARLEQDKAALRSAKAERRVLDAVLPQSITKYFPPFDRLAQNRRGELLDDEIDAGVRIDSNPTRRQSDTQVSDYRTDEKF